MQSSNSETVYYTIQVDGKAISTLIQVQSILVDKAIDGDGATVDVLASNDGTAVNTFKIGSKINIGMGYDGKAKNVFNGVVAKASFSVSAEEGKILSFYCEGEANAPAEDAEVTLSADDIFNARISWDDAKYIEGYLQVTGNDYLVGTQLKLDQITTNGNTAIINMVSHYMAKGAWTTELYFDGEPEQQTDDTPTQNQQPTSSAANPVAAPEPQKRIELATAGGNTLVLDDESKSITLQDANGNQVVLGSNGISIKSANNISITANQVVNIAGNMGINQKASAGDVVTTGMNIRQSADMEVNINGSASTKIEAGAELVLKGGLIMIN